MNHYTFTAPDGTKVRRVSKKAARNVYDAGGTVYLQSCNFVPFGAWQNALDVRKDDHIDCWGKPLAFESLVRDFEWYNCSHEQGYYASYYVPVKETSR